MQRRAETPQESSDGARGEAARAEGHANGSRDPLAELPSRRRACRLQASLRAHGNVRDSRAASRSGLTRPRPLSHWSFSNLPLLCNTAVPGDSWLQPARSDARPKRRSLSSFQQEFLTEA